MPEMMKVKNVTRIWHFHQMPRVDRGGIGGHDDCEMSMRAKLRAAPSKVPVFPIACWVLGLMAFSQVLVAGLALGARFESSRQVRIVDREVVKLVAVQAPAKDPVPQDAVVSHPPQPSRVIDPPAALVLPPPTPLATPSIADPRSEQLLNEARQARVAGDMGLAILKLEEANGRSPDDPNIHYEMGLVHEVMGVFDTAADHFEKVRQMGVAGAGALYQKASEKLRDGFEPEVPLGKLSLGRVRIYNDPGHDGGQQVILTIPVEKAPDVEIELKDLTVTVEFFNRSTHDGIIPLEDKSWATDQWVSEPCDWAQGSEDLRMTYVIPKQDQATEHLFGEQTYYGYVVSLLYNGEVLDMKAWPPGLAARSIQKVVNPSQSPTAPEFLDKDNLPPDFDPNLPMVLPPR